MNIESPKRLARPRGEAADRNRIDRLAQASGSGVYSFRTKIYDLVRPVPAKVGVEAGRARRRAGDLRVAKKPPTEAKGGGRLSKQHWIEAAADTLVNEGIDRLKVQVLSRKLGVARSSFYWHFETIEALHEELIHDWLRKNTGPILERASRPAPTITKAVCNVFECWADARLFDPRLDIAVRVWGRIDRAVAAVVGEGDSQRVDALTRMFLRYGFAPEEAFTRARVLYFTQIGHYTLGLAESAEVRLSHLRSYLVTFTGREPSQAEIADFTAFVGKAKAAQG